MTNEKKVKQFFSNFKEGSKLSKLLCYNEATNEIKIYYDCSGNILAPAGEVALAYFDSVSCDLLLDKNDSFESFYVKVLEKIKDIENSYLVSGNQLFQD